MLTYYFYNQNTNTDGNHQVQCPIAHIPPKRSIPLPWGCMPIAKRQSNMLNPLPEKRISTAVRPVVEVSKRANRKPGRFLVLKGQ